MTSRRVPTAEELFLVFGTCALPRNFKHIILDLVEEGGFGEQNTTKAGIDMTSAYPMHYELGSFSFINIYYLVDISDFSLYRKMLIVSHKASKT